MLSEALEAFDKVKAEGGNVAQAAVAAAEVLDMDPVEAFNLLVSTGNLRVTFHRHGRGPNNESLRFIRG